TCAWPDWTKFRGGSWATATRPKCSSRPRCDNSSRSAHKAWSICIMATLRPEAQPRACRVDRSPSRGSMFFSFDGLDGVGKSTQMDLFVEWLRAAGHDVVECRDPGSTPLGEAIRAMLL